MERKVLFKNNPHIESGKRLNMAYLLLKDPQIIEVMKQTGSYFFHGTNANALPGILKYGINSVDKSKESNIEVSTGEQWSRFDGKRSFVSITDCMDTSLFYASMQPNEDAQNLLNFGVLIGISLEKMEGIQASGVMSDLSEIGIVGNLPLDNIKFLAVPEDKVEFVEKLVGNKGIKVISMDLKDKFYGNNYPEKLQSLEQGKDKEESQDLSYPTYSQDDVRPLIEERRASKIKEIFEYLKSKIHTHNRQTDDKTISERG